jgi:hypothetical protein
MEVGPMPADSPATPEPDAAAHRIVDTFDKLDQLQQQEARRRARAVVHAWLSVGAATLVLAALVLYGERQVADLAEQRTELENQRTTLEEELERIKTETETAKKARDDAQNQLLDTQTQLRQEQARLATVTQTLGKVPQEVRSAALENQLRADPSAAKLLPRAYVQIVDRGDREWAADVSRRLERAGIVVPGIEYVPRAAALGATDVRYYKESEKDGAERIREILASIGVNAKLVYLNEEENTRVRPNHYEVWFAAGSRKAPLQ